MALPNYSPSGVILFGCVPWDNGYSHVRLYGGLDEQYSDIRARMAERTENYVYVGRDRRLKVDIEADRLYHCNYCMYRNESLTDGWIYCFISDVAYVNDHTTEVTLETDVFQTYLYGVDWTVPPCFIERETVPGEDSKYLLTNEPDFPLIYEVDSQVHAPFHSGGAVVMCTGHPEKSNDLVEIVVNLGGWFMESSKGFSYKGIPMGATLIYIPKIGAQLDMDNLNVFLEGVTKAGSIDSVVSIFTIPDFASFPPYISVSNGDTDNPVYWKQAASDSTQEFGNIHEYQFSTPEWGDSVDGYIPDNRKLLYYPYTFCRLTDFNGSSSDLRYELMGNAYIDVKYIISPACKAYVYPDLYRSIQDYDSGFVTTCGALGSWSSNQFQTWLAQNAGTVAITAASIAVAGISGGASLAGAANSLRAASGLGRAAASASRVGSQNLTRASAWAAAQGAEKAASGIRNLELAAGMSAAGAATLYTQSRQPTVTRGQADADLLWGKGIQGVAAQRICVKAEVAQQIDQWFKRWGYAVERIEAVNIVSRETFNYVKTGGAAPKSLNARAGIEAPFTRGRGTPASSLDVIRAAFDGGVTFWHTTDGFGDYSASNAIV